MLITCWSVKGGSGVSVTAAGLAGLMAERHGGAAVVDLGGDMPALLGVPEPSGPGLRDWCDSEASSSALERLVVEVSHDLRLVPVGRGSDRIGPSRAAQMVEALRTLAPAVVVDAGPPLLADAERAGTNADVSPRGHADHLRDAGSSLFVTRPCYLSLSRARAARVRADGVVVVRESGRVLEARAVGEVLGLPVVGVIEVDPSVARAVDAGTFARRVPARVSRGLRHAG